MRPELEHLLVARGGKPAALILDLERDVILRGRRAEHDVAVTRAEFDRVAEQVRQRGGEQGAIGIDFEARLDGPTLPRADREKAAVRGPAPDRSAAGERCETRVRACAMISA